MNNLTGHHHHLCLWLQCCDQGCKIFRQFVTITTFNLSWDVGIATTNNNFTKFEILENFLMLALNCLLFEKRENILCVVLWNNFVSLNLCDGRASNKFRMKIASKICFLLHNNNIHTKLFQNIKFFTLEASHRKLKPCLQSF